VTRCCLYNPRTPTRFRSVANPNMAKGKPGASAPTDTVSEGVQQPPEAGAPVSAEAHSPEAQGAVLALKTIIAARKLDDDAEKIAEDLEWNADAIMQRAVDFFQDTDKSDDDQKPSERQLNGTPRNAAKHPLKTKQRPHKTPQIKNKQLPPPLTVKTRLPLRAPSVPYVTAAPKKKRTSN
jgi:hypothetical protein